MLYYYYNYLLNASGTKISNYKYKMIDLRKIKPCPSFQLVIIIIIIKIFTMSCSAPKDYAKSVQRGDNTQMDAMHQYPGVKDTTESNCFKASAYFLRCIGTDSSFIIINIIFLLHYELFSYSLSNRSIAPSTGFESAVISRFCSTFHFSISFQIKQRISFKFVVARRREFVISCKKMNNNCT